MKDHIVVMTTFADGKIPPVTQALSKAEVPYTEYFQFNNSALFENNVDRNDFTKLFWNLGQESYNQFFNRIRCMPAKSLKLTKEVLNERDRLELNINSLLPAIEKCLNKMNEIERHEKCIMDYEKKIKEGKNFVMKETRTRETRKKIPAGTHVTYCFNCHHTCHYPCRIPKDEDKRQCIAMKDGKCTICLNKCPWDSHSNTGYQLSQYEEVYEVTVEHLKEKYMQGLKGKKNTEIILGNIKKEKAKLEADTAKKIDIIIESLNRLNEIALKQDPLNDIQYIEMLIKSEKNQGKVGFQGRIESLEKLKAAAILKKAVASKGKTMLKNPSAI